MVVSSFESFGHGAVPQGRRATSPTVPVALTHILQVDFSKIVEKIDGAVLAWAVLGHGIIQRILDMHSIPQPSRDVVILSGQKVPWRSTIADVPLGKQQSSHGL